MLGLIKKDILLMKSNLKSMIFIFIVYLFMTFQGTLDIVYIIPLIGLMLFISTFSYDDYNNWNSYAVTFPNGRKNVVKAKYVSSIIITIILGIVAFVLSIGMEYFNNNSIDLEETLSALTGTLFSCVLIISLLYPINFKYGATTGKIIVFVLVFAIFGIGTILMNNVDINKFSYILNILDKYPIILALIVPLIMLGVSYLISNKIYKNKEF